MTTIPLCLLGLWPLSAAGPQHMLAHVHPYVLIGLDLRGVRRQQRLDLVREHRWETVGLGGAVLLFGFVPFLGSVLLATAAVGAVLTYRRWQFGVPVFLPRNQGEVIR